MYRPGRAKKRAQSNAPNSPVTYTLLSPAPFCHLHSATRPTPLSPTLLCQLTLATRITDESSGQGAQTGQVDYHRARAQVLPRDVDSHLLQAALHLVVHPAAGRSCQTMPGRVAHHAKASSMQPHTPFPAVHAVHARRMLSVRVQSTAGQCGRCWRVRRPLRHALVRAHMPAEQDRCAHGEHAQARAAMTCHAPARWAAAGHRAQLASATDSAQGLRAVSNEKARTAFSRTRRAAGADLESNLPLPH